jgi:hypothetical protein
MPEIDNLFETLDYKDDSISSKTLVEKPEDRLPSMLLIKLKDWVNTPLPT